MVKSLGMAKVRRAEGATPLRAGILAALAQGPASVGQLAQHLGASRTSVRHHLQVLMTLGLVRREDGLFALARGETDVEVMPAEGLPCPVLLPPSECLRCANAPYVLELVEEMGRLLWAAREQKERLRRLSAQILQAQEEERQRVARELHDDTAQALTALLVHLKLLQEEAGPSLAPRLAELRQMVAATLEGVRRLALALRPSALDHLGLGPALAAYVEDFSRRWGLPVHLRLGRLPPLPQEAELALYRVAQEALSNVAKHAHAHQVWLSLHRRGPTVVLEVRDDGQGFPVQEVLGDRQRGLGLFGMRERLALVGGRLDIDSRPGEGTKVRAQLPLRPKKVEPWAR